MPSSPPPLVFWLQRSVPTTLLVVVGCLMDTSVSHNLQPDEAGLADVSVNIDYIGMMLCHQSMPGSLRPLHYPWDWMDYFARVGEWGLTAGGEPSRVPAHGAFSSAGLLVPQPFSLHRAVAWGPHTERHFFRLSS